MESKTKEKNNLNKWLKKQDEYEKTKDRIWVYGDQLAGYSYRPIDDEDIKRHKAEWPDEPPIDYTWRTEIWYEGRIVRHDGSNSKSDAIKYINDRREIHTRHGTTRMYPKSKNGEPVNRSEENLIWLKEKFNIQ